MKKLVLSTVVMLALSMGGAALAEDKAPADKPATKKSSVKRERTVTATAIVQAINLDKRIVTLKGPEGEGLRPHGRRRGQEPPPGEGRGRGQDQVLRIHRVPSPQTGRGAGAGPGGRRGGQGETG